MLYNGIYDNINIENDLGVFKMRKKREGRKQNLPTKYKKSKKVFKIITSILLIIFLIILAGVIFIGIKVSDFVAKEIESCADFVDVIASGALKNLEYSTFIYDKDGNQIDTLHGNEDRIFVKYEDIPLSVIDAVLSIEDERYFEHSGIDYKRTFGAAYTYITNNGSSDFGGSTITQQLVKNVTEDKETNVNRKIREWYRASVLESKFS